MQKHIGKNEELVIVADNGSTPWKCWLPVWFADKMCEEGHFKKITTYYYEVGHSYNDSDRLSGIVENRIKSEKGVFTPEQWVEAASNSTRNKTVRGHLVEREEFKNYESTLEKQYKKPTVNNEKKNVAITRYCDFGEIQISNQIYRWTAWEVSAAHPGVVKYTESYKENDWHEVNILKPEAKRHKVDLASAPQMYDKNFPLSLVVQWNLATCANVPASVKGSNTRHNLYCVPCDPQGFTIPRPTQEKERQIRAEVKARVAQELQQQPGMLQCYMSTE